jgi:two-component system, NtrC family, response regulator AtoC
VQQILVCEDEAPIRTAIVEHLSLSGYSVVSASDGEEALLSYASTMPDAVVLDLQMPRLGGLAVLQRLRAAEPQLPVIVVTADATLVSAIEATRLGATAYLVKPFDGHELDVQLSLVLPDPSVASAVARYGGLVGSSAAMLKLFSVLRALERVDAPTVLIGGETGTGKDVVARAIHSQGPRKDQPFIAVDCASLPATLIESELFGHERGSFTDAHAAKPGLFELAKGGLIFLDEIGELAFATQAKLLRALESRTFRRVGGTIDIPLRAGVLAASNRKLKDAVTARLFRADLYFRLNVVPLEIPPLRDRPQDIEPIANHLIGELATDLGRGVVGITRGAVAELEARAWPGNVRELRNVLERAMILKDGDGPIARADLPAEEIESLTLPRSPSSLELPADGIDLAMVERDLLRQAITRCNGNLTHAAKLLGLTRFALRYRLNKHGIDRALALPRR